jgi:hypothetical protein
VLIDVQGAHPNLMPDLTASLDVELARIPGSLVIPRDAIRYDGPRALVNAQRGSRFDEREVTIAAVSAHEAAVASGLEEGTVIARNVSAGPGR